MFGNTETHFGSYYSGYRPGAQPPITGAPPPSGETSARLHGRVRDADSDAGKQAAFLEALGLGERLHVLFARPGIHVAPEDDERSRHTAADRSRSAHAGERGESPDHLHRPYAELLHQRHGGSAGAVPGQVIVLLRAQLYAIENRFPVVLQVLGMELLPGESVLQERRIPLKDLLIGPNPRLQLLQSLYERIPDHSAAPFRSMNSLQRFLRRGIASSASP